MAISKIPVVAGTKTLTRGSIVSGNASGEPAALAIGSNNQVLKSDGTDAVWGTDSSGTITAFTNGVDNRVVTATSATALNGEANLTFSDGKNLGVGTAAPNSFSGYSTVTIGGSNSTTGSGLDFENNSGTILARLFGDASGAQYGTASGLSHRFEVDGSEKIRILSSGNVGIGETVPLGKLHVKSADSGQGSVGGGADELVLENSGTSGLTILSGTSNPGNIYFGDSGNSSIGYISYTHNGDYMAFQTNAAERYRVLSDGKIQVGIASTSDPSASVAGTQIKPNGAINLSRGSGTGGHGVFGFYNGNGYVGGVDTSGGSTNFVTSSDYRLKENVDYAFDATTRLKQLKPARFNFKTDANITVDGFLAHEVETIVPEAIRGEKDGMHPEVLYTEQVLYDDNDVLPEGKNIGDVKHSIGDVEHAETIDPQGIDQGKLVPLLVKSLQEALAEIDTLKTKVEALENA